MTGKPGTTIGSPRDVQAPVGILAQLGRMIPRGILYPPLFFPSILLLLEEEPTHGYKLQKKLVDIGIVNAEMDPSILYKVLRRFEEHGMALSEHFKGSGGPARRVYRLTDSGREALDFWALRLERMDELIDWFQDRYKAQKQGEHRGRTDDKPGA